MHHTEYKQPCYREWKKKCPASHRVLQHASSLELLKDHLKEGKKALDVGSGSGYLTACMAIMVSPQFLHDNHGLLYQLGELGELAIKLTIIIFVSQFLSLFTVLKIYFYIINSDLRYFLPQYFHYSQVGKTGKVVAVEHIGSLVDDSRNNIKKNHEDLLTSGRVILVKGDGRQGYQKEAPYDAIHVGAAAPSIPVTVGYVCR